MEKWEKFKDDGLDLGQDKSVFIRSLITTEGKKQVRKWGCQDRYLVEWMNFLTEEVGELAQAISEYMYRGASLENVMKEAVQVATLAIKIIKMTLFNHTARSILKKFEKED